MTNTDRQRWQDAILEDSNRAEESVGNTSDFALLVDEDTSPQGCCSHLWCLRTRGRRIGSGITLLVLVAGCATLLYFVLLTRYPSVSSADSTSFVYDPLELKLVGNHQVFYVENTNWLSQISVKDISIAALYTDSEGGITSLGSGRPRSNATVVISGGSRAKIFVDLALNVYSYPAWEEISMACFHGRNIALDFVAVMQVKLSNRAKYENLQFGPMHDTPSCSVLVN